jgi:hypothetical protein
MFDAVASELVTTWQKTPGLGDAIGVWFAHGLLTDWTAYIDNNVRSLMFRQGYKRDSIIIHEFDGEVLVFPKRLIARRLSLCRRLGATMTSVPVHDVVVRCLRFKM